MPLGLNQGVQPGPWTLLLPLSLLLTFFSDFLRLQEGDCDILSLSVFVIPLKGVMIGKKTSVSPPRTVFTKESSVYKILVESVLSVYLYMRGAV